MNEKGGVMGGKRLLILPLLLLVVLVLAGCTTTLAPTSTTVPTPPMTPIPITTTEEALFTSDEYDFSITIPTGWYFEGEETVLETNMLFFRVQGTAQEQWSENVNIYYITVETPSLAQLESEKELIVDNLIEGMHAIYPDLTLMDSYTSKVASYSALTIIYTYEVLQGMQIHLYTDGRCYLLTYTAYQNTYDTYLTDFQVMVNSFQRL